MLAYSRGDRGRPQADHQLVRHLDVYRLRLPDAGHHLLGGSSRTKSAAQFYSAGGGITGVQNGIAISGDYMSAASFLGISGLSHVRV